MATGDNMMGIALEITADPSKATAAIDEFQAKVKSAATSAEALNAATAQGARDAASATESLAAAQGQVNATADAMRRTIAESLQMQGASAEEAAQIYRQMGISGQQAAAEISAAFGEVGAAEQGAAEEAQTMSGSLFSSFSNLRAFRMLMYSTLGLVSFGFYITEWQKVAQAISEASLALGGFSKEQQDVLAQQEKFNLKLVASNPDVLKQNVQNAVKNYDTIKAELDKAQAQMKAAGVFSAAAADPMIAVTQRLTVSQFQLQQQVKDLQGQLAQADVEEQKAELALGEYQRAHKKATETVKAHRSEVDKVAQAQQRWDEAILTAHVIVPKLITDIDRENAAIAQQESGLRGTLQILKEKLQLQREGVQTPSQLGFVVPGMPAGPLDQQLNAVAKLTAAQQAALPTERELALANQELAREYPNLTAAEREEWAQIMLTSEAYRQHIDSAHKVRSTNAELSSSFRTLAGQVRTAFSEMAGQITGWGGVATRVFDQIFNAVSRQIEIEQRQVALHQIAQVSMAKATIDGLKQIAVVKAVVDFAKGLEELAEAFMGHPGAAAAAVQDFAAAAVWGTVGAFQVASMAGAFSPGASGSKMAASAGTTTAAASSAGAAPALASGTQSANAAAASPQQTLQVIVHGNVYGRNGMTELAQHLSSAVKFNRVQLVASHTIAGKAIR